MLENSTLSGNFLHECPKILGRKKKQQKKKKKMQKKTVTMMKKKGKKKEKKKMKEKRKTKSRFEGASFLSGGCNWALSHATYAGELDDRSPSSRLKPLWKSCATAFVSPRSVTGCP